MFQQGMSTWFKPHPNENNSKQETGELGTSAVVRLPDANSFPIAQLQCRLPPERQRMLVLVMVEASAQVPHHELTSLMYLVVLPWFFVAVTLMQCLLLAVLLLLLLT